MLKFLNAFRKPQGNEPTGAPSSIPGPLRGATAFSAARTSFALGLVCLPIGLGCRSGAPTDWVGQRVAMTESWQSQNSYVRGEDASFQEGWRRGYLDGQAGVGQISPEREPAQFEAFMHSKREEAVQNWRRGYDAGFTSSFQNNAQHESHAQLFPAPSSRSSAPADPSGPQEAGTGVSSSPSLFGIPRNQPSPATSPARNGSESIAQPNSTLPSSNRQPPHASVPALTNNSAVPQPLPSNPLDSQKTNGFENAAELLDSVIKKNTVAEIATEGVPSEESAVDAANIKQSEADAIEQPEAAEPNPTNDAIPNSDRSILELPLDDDDVASSAESQFRLGTESVTDSAQNLRSLTANDVTDFEARAISQIRSAETPASYAGRMQSGLVVANPYASTKSDPLPQRKAAPQASNVVTRSAGYIQTSSGEFATTATIATQMNHSPTLPVNHETQPDAFGEVELGVPKKLPKGLPLKVKSTAR
ncbi:MAG: hypothetical protein JNL67_11265 [Planctomycetaceae bacterium]|nr:hypothetical protein [Planctomycetaceae bacterium]